MQRLEYKKVIGFTKQQKEAFKTLEEYGIKDLPKEGDLGKITFMKSNNQMNGYWHYEGVNY
jgi:hypothetical protein